MSAGGIGAHVVRLALEQGHTVVALARDPSKITASGTLLRTAAFDVSSAKATNVLGSSLKGTDLVLSCLGNRRGEAKVVEAGTSAVLAAIQICLGAGARRTNRASSLSSLINHNGKATHAKLRVKLLNKGSDAFQHEVYGDYVTVERVIDKNGGSDYKLLDEKDRKKSTVTKKSPSRSIL